MVAADDATRGRQSHVMAWHLSGTRTVPTLTADAEIAVAPYAVPRPAFDFIFPQIDTLDARLTMAVANDDPSAGGQQAVWTVHTVDPGNGTVVTRWYELLPAAGMARQIGTLGQPFVDTYNGSISPTADGRATVLDYNRSVLDYNRSGLLLLPEIDTRVHTAAMANGSTGPSVRMGSSTAPDWDLSCTPVCRWGDYSNASPDPTVASAVWVASQVISAPGGLFPSWITRIAKVSPSG